MLRRISIAVGSAFVIGVHLIALTSLGHRHRQVDETETLQAAMMMREGQRIYVDFAEHHPPFVFAMLEPFAPPIGAPLGQTERYIVRARALFALFGFVALGAVAWLVWRASGRAYAPVLFAALAISTPAIWISGFADVRAEPPSLALWWCGAALVMMQGTTTWRAIARGVGIALVANACLWNPKWPVSSLVIGVFFLLSLRGARRHALASLAAATAVIAAGVAWLAMLTDLRLFVQHVFVFTRGLVAWADALQARVGEGTPFFHGPQLFRPLYVVIAAVLVAIGLWLRPNAVRERRVAVMFLLLLAAALIEIRFIYPYPEAWAYYYIVWTLAAAAVLSFLPAVLQELLPRMKITAAIPVVMTMLAMLGTMNILPASASTDRDPNWRTMLYVTSRMGPQDTIWADMPWHPLGARLDHYYWFGFGDFVPASLRFARTKEGSFLPRIAEEDLPICRLERGLEPHLRFVAGRDQYNALPVVLGCFDRLMAKGTIVPTPVPNTCMVVRPGDAPLMR